VGSRGLVDRKGACRYRKRSSWTEEGRWETGTTYQHHVIVLCRKLRHRNKVETNIMISCLLIVFPFPFLLHQMATWTKLIRFLDSAGKVQFGSPIAEDFSKAKLLKGTPFNGTLTDTVVSVSKVWRLLSTFFFFLTDRISARGCSSCLPLSLPRSSVLD